MEPTNPIFPRHFRTRLKHAEGFTLLETLIACAILVTLAAIAIPAYSNFLLTSKEEQAIEDLRQIEKMLHLYDVEHGFLPETLSDADIDLVDPWGNPYQYTLIEGKPLTGAGKVSPRKDKSLHPLNSDYDLWSKGPDGDTALALTAKASHDDIIRAGDGTFFGVAGEY